MKQILSKIGTVSVIAVVIAISLSFPAQTAEKKVTYSLKSKQLISQNTVYPGDVPNHQLVQVVRLNSYTASSDPDWKDAEQMVYAQDDQIAGSGTHKGTYVIFHKDGDKSYGTFAVTHKTTVKEGGAWESTYEGKYQYTGGTGKFKNIKGSGTYKGKVTPEGVA